MVSMKAVCEWAIEILLIVAVVLMMRGTHAAGTSGPGPKGHDPARCRMCSNAYLQPFTAEAFDREQGRLAGDPELVSPPSMWEKTVLSDAGPSSGWVAWRFPPAR